VIGCDLGPHELTALEAAVAALVDQGRFEDPELVLPKATRQSRSTTIPQVQHE